MKTPVIDIYLRPLQINDAFTSYTWRNNPKIWKYTGSKPDIKITKEIELEWIDTVLKRTNEKRFAICIQGSDEYVGNVQFTDIINDKAEFHIFIGNTNYWGKGIGKEATKLIVEYGFKQMQLKSIFLYVHKKNIAAIAAYRKAGFAIEKSENDQILMIINNR